MKKYIWLICSFLFALPLFISRNIIVEDSYDGKEKFNASLFRIQSVATIQAYVDSVATASNISVSSASYLLLAEEIISERFYHGYSHLQLNENWIAVLTEKITGIGVSAKVQPEQILQNKNAACSQQSIVLMEILKSKKIPYRKIGFPHHYVLEAKLQNNWYYLDPDMEPVATDSLRKKTYWQKDIEKLRQFYPHQKEMAVYRFNNTDKIEEGPVNEIPAIRVKIFQSITFILSYTLWIIPLIVFFVKRKK